jgi:superfamily II DNA helicase RecQ
MLNLSLLSLRELLMSLNDLGDRNQLRNVLEALYRKCFILRFVIDEAHCIRKWGSEFQLLAKNYK